MLDSWNLRWLAATGVSLLVAAIYAVFVPNADKVNRTEGIQFFIVRWGHSLVWVILAVSFLMRATQQKKIVRWANPVSVVGGLLYLLFLVMFKRL